MSKTWKLMKLAFEYFSLGFQRIIFMILGAQIAFIMCYLFFCEILYGTTIPALPAGYTQGAQTLTGAMVMAGLAAIVITIEILLVFAAIALVAGYVRHYLAVLSYYDEEKYAGYKSYRSGKTPDWLMNTDIGKEAELQRLEAVLDCRRKCKAIREGTE
jgi:hypothetical protein